MFELCPIVLNDVQHIFPGGAKKILVGDSPPLCPHGYGLDYNPDKDGILHKKHCTYISKY